LRLGSSLKIKKKGGEFPSPNCLSILVDSSVTEMEIKIKKYTKKEWKMLTAFRLLHPSYLTRGEVTKKIQWRGKKISVTFIAPMKEIPVGRKVRPRQVLSIIRITQMNEKEIENFKEILLEMAKKVAQRQEWYLPTELYVELIPNF
jgi:hypothetical protein